MAGIEGVLILLVIGLVGFIVSVLLEAVLIWLASKILKFNKQDFRTAFSVALVYTVATMVLFAICLVPMFILPTVGALITLLLLLIACLADIAILIYLIRKYYEVDWKNAILAFVIVFVLEIILSILLALPLMIFGTVLWQLGIFNVGPTSTVTTGWSKLYPLSQTIVYTAADQEFSASFINTVGTTIKVDDISAAESVTNTACTLKNSPVGTTIGAGDAFKIDVQCASASKNKGDTYNMAISVQYSAVTGALITTRTEEGTIRGPVE